ncbi:glycosyltransferase family 2 protein [Bombella favorum]|uniref:Glycosyltransferase family 2 protein n=1 Tax=Bombella favorum TaxID=2039164 RepID=A0ABR5ZNP5_9PROT|nr:glycosyltransferase family 2 protein [Bombella favorum]MBA5725931.1 hypothetical protein [Bombella favorum]
MFDRLPRLTCAVLLKQADRNLLGWLAWHLALGIEHIAIMDSGAFDDARQIVQSLQQDWPLSWHPVEAEPDQTPEEHRLEMTRQAISHLHHVTQAMPQEVIDEENGETTPVDDWVIVLDADEYLAPSRELISLLYQAKEETTAFALHWRIYGDAGLLTPPPGHVVANHTWHAPPMFADHRFVRLIARLDCLPTPAKLTDPHMLGLSPEQILRPNGRPFIPGDEALHSELWEGGCIQHYICALAHNEEELPPPMRAYYNRNEQMTAPQTRDLQTMRQLANQLRESALRAGLSRLQKLVEPQLEEAQLKHQEDETDLAIRSHVQHDTFHYDRIRSSVRSDLLLNPQFSTRYETGQTVLLRFPEGRLLEGDPPNHHEPLIGFRLESTPHLLTLYGQDRSPFTLGDAPCPFGMASLRITPSTQQQFVHLPHETGHGSTPLEIIPTNAVPAFLYTPLPPIDEPDGLSVHGLLTWLAGHPDLQPYDLARALLLLSPASAQHLHNLAPILAEFLPSQPKPDFLP